MAAKTNRPRPLVSGRGRLVSYSGLVVAERVAYVAHHPAAPLQHMHMQQGQTSQQQMARRFIQHAN